MKIIVSAKGKDEGPSHLHREVTLYPPTPDQFYERTSGTSETRLLFAVLEDAIRCYTQAAASGRRADQRALEEVKEWVNTRGDHDLFSFDSICRVLDLEPERLRHQLNSLERVKIRARRFRTVGRRVTISVNR